MNLPPTEVRTLPLQSNNCRLKFKNPPAPMQSVELNWDNQGFQSVHSGSSITETNWLTPPSSFMTIGIHNLKINFTAINSFSREYIVFVTEPCQRFYVDGTISSLTTGNTLTLWDNPNCPDAEPLLLSEGFDPTDSRFPEFYRFQGDELTQRIFELGYKVYVLNYNLAGQNMQNNAAVYIAALRYLSQINDGKKAVNFLDRQDIGNFSPEFWPFNQVRRCNLHHIFEQQKTVKRLQTRQCTGLRRRFKAEAFEVLHEVGNHFGRHFGGSII